MRTIRQCCFETNSSSTHSITLCVKNDYEKWKNGELYYFEEKLITPEQRDEIIRKYIVEDKMDIDYENQTITFMGKTVSFKDKSYFKIRDGLITPELLAEVTQEEVDNFLEGCGLDDTPLTFEEYEEHFLEEYHWYMEKLAVPNSGEVIAFGYYGNDY